MVYLQITLKIADANRGAAAGVYDRAVIEAAIAAEGRPPAPLPPTAKSGN